MRFVKEALPCKNLMAKCVRSVWLFYRASSKVVTLQIPSSYFNKICLIMFNVLDKWGVWGKIFFWGCVKSLLPPTAAEYSFERHMIFMISQSEIMKIMCLSKYNLARSAMKILFTQPLEKEYSAAVGGKILCNLLRSTKNDLADSVDNNPLRQI